MCCTSCKEPYEHPAIHNNPAYLVVEGVLTSSPDSTFITLTRTRNIADSTPPVPEENALVLVETENGGTVPLGEIHHGVYGGMLFLDRPILIVL